MKITYKLLSVASVCIANSVLALPTVYPTAETLSQLHKVINNTSSNLISDSVNPQVVFVMPPNSAYSVVDKKLHMRTANLGFCKEMGSLQKYSAHITEEMANFELRRREKKKELDAVGFKLAQARQELAEYAVKEKLQELEDLDCRINELELLVKEKTKEIREASDEQRVLLRTQIADHSQELTLNTRRREMARIHTRALNGYERKKKSVEGHEEDLRDINKQWSNIDADLESLRIRFLSIFKDLGSLEGGRASMKFTSDWTENMEKLRAQNYNYEFQKIETQKAVFTTDLPDLKHIPSGAAVLSYKLSSCNSVGSACESTAYPESNSGTVVLSNIGACPIEHPEYFDFREGSSSDELRLGMTVAYEYPTAMTVRATAKYNMYKIYEKIAKSGRKGGFFSPKSWSSMEEKNFFRDEFVVNWLVQDPGVAPTEAQKNELEQEMRNNIFARLAKIGLPSVADPSALISPTVPKSGAAVLGSELSKSNACQSNKYCIAATIGVNILDAIFGSGSSSANYMNIQDVELKDEWSSTSVVFKPYITSYINK